MSYLHPEVRGITRAGSPNDRDTRRRDIAPSHPAGWCRLGRGRTGRKPARICVGGERAAAGHLAGRFVGTVGVRRPDRPAHRHLRCSRGGRDQGRAAGHRAYQQRRSADRQDRPQTHPRFARQAAHVRHRRFAGQAERCCGERQQLYLRRQGGGDRRLRVFGRGGCAEQAGATRARDLSTYCQRRE